MKDLFRAMIESAKHRAEARKSKLTPEQLALCEEARRLQRNIEIERYKEGDDEIIIEAQDNYMIIKRTIPGSPFKHEIMEIIAPKDEQ